MTQVLEILEELSSTRKRTEKEDIIMKYHGHSDLREVARLAYDPRINFFMKKVPAAKYPPLSHETRTLTSLSEALQRIEDNLATRNVTGSDADEYVAALLGGMRTEDATVLERVIKKDLRCGVGATTWEDLFANFRIEPYMQCSSMNEKNLARIVYPAHSQTKLDGMFANCVVTGEARWLSRNGTELHVPEHITNAMIKLNAGTTGVYHGELIIRNTDGSIMQREDANPLFSNGDAVTPEYADRVEFVMWDCIPLLNFDEKTNFDVSYILRLNKLEKQCMDYMDWFYKNNPNKTCPVYMVATKLVTSYDGAMLHFNEVLSEGGEGTVLKNMDSNWRDAKNPGWVKLKEIKEADLVVVGYKEGEGKYAGGIGSLLCHSSCGLLEVGVAGLTDEQRGFKSNDTGVELIEGFDLNMYTGKIITIQFNDVIKNKDNPNIFSLFLPRVCKNSAGEIVFRDDKSVADTLEQIKDKKMGG